MLSVMIIITILCTSLFGELIYASNDRDSYNRDTNEIVVSNFDQIK